MREFLQELLKSSQEVIGSYYKKRRFSVTQKPDGTPVTAADQEAERIMRKLINARFPDHGIIGEEYGIENADAEYTWVLDPIDGTIAFLHGVPLFTTLIALLKDKTPILGGICQPIADLTCIGDNESAWFNGEAVRMREIKSLSEASLFATDVMNIEKLHGPNGFLNLVAKAKLFRTWGDGFGYLLLASGRGDIMVDAKMAPWDILPVIPVVQGAGAKITTFAGGDAVTGTSAVCAHPSLHREVMDILHAQKR